MTSSVNRKKFIREFRNNKEKFIIISLITGICFLGILILTQNAKADGNWVDYFFDDSKVETKENVRINGYCSLKSNPILNPSFEDDFENWMEYRNSNDGTGSYLSEIVTSPVPPTGENKALHLIVKEANDYQILGFYQEIDVKYKEDLKSVKADIYPISGECFGNQWYVSIDVTAYDWGDEYLGMCSVILKNNGITPKSNDIVLDLFFDTYTSINENVYEKLNKDLSDNENSWNDVSYISIDLVVFQGAGSKAGAYFDNIMIGNYGEFEYLTYGEIESKQIELSENCIWDTLTINKNEYENHEIKVSVINSSSGNTILGFEDLEEDDIDISLINPLKYPKIQLIAEFFGNGTSTPILNYWEVNWVESSWKDDFENQDKIEEMNDVLIYEENIELLHWTKRRPITISNLGNSLTNYQVKVDVNYDSNMNSDFSDLRFVDSDDKTMLYYWIEEFTLISDATVWVKIPLIPSGDKTIYMYYSNPFVSSVSDPENTLELYDNFNDDWIDPNKWDMSMYYETHSDCWMEERNNRLEFVTPKNVWNRILTKKTFDDFALNVKVNHWSSVADNMIFSGIYGRIVNKEESRDKKCMQVRPEFSFHRLYNVDGGYVEQTISANLRSWYKHEFILYGTTMKSKFRNYDYLTNTFSSPSSGRIGIGDASDGIVYYDDIWVRKYTSPEPTTSIQSEQNTYFSVLSNGVIISNKITLPKNCNWQKIEINKTEPINTKIEITILDGETDEPISGFENLEEKEIDISPINLNEHSTLKLKAEFTGTEDSTPQLHNWSVEFKHIPIAWLSAEPIIFYINEDIDFSAQESWSLENKIIQYKYDFGDSKTDWIDKDTIKHQYTEKTKFTARLKVKDNEGTESNWSKNLTIKIINRPPISKLDLTTLTPYTNQKITFDATSSTDLDGEIVEYYFNFGDESGSGWISEKKVTHNYSEHKEYDVSLKVKDNEGLESEWYNLTITVKNRPPTIVLTLTPKQPTINDEIKFDVSGSYDEDGDIISYTFDFGDGNLIENTTNKIVKHKYESKKTFQVKIKAIDDDNTLYEWYEIDIIVKNKLPEASLQVTPQNAYINTNVKFDAANSFDDDGYILKYKFDFDDSTTTEWITESSIFHNYTKQGKYKVKVKVMDNDNDESNWSEEIEVIIKNRAPVAIINTPNNNDEFSVNKEIEFDASKSVDDDGDKLTYKWESNIDNILYDGKNASFNIKLSEGKHTITLTVTDSHGDFDTDEITIIVKKETKSSGNGDSLNIFYIGLIVGVFVIIGGISIFYKQKISTISETPSNQHPPQYQQNINQPQWKAPAPQIPTQIWQRPPMTQTMAIGQEKKDTTQEINIKCPVCGNMMSIKSSNEQMKIRCNICGAEGNIGT